MVDGVYNALCLRKLQLCTALITTPDSQEVGWAKIGRLAKEGDITTVEATANNADDGQNLVPSRTWLRWVPEKSISRLHT